MTEQLVIKVTRHKSAWSVYITYPDGSYEHLRGVPEYQGVQHAVSRAVWKLELQRQLTGAA